ncbi:carbon starvation CstA family protein [Mucisphaera calidilacus]|uniref:Carbon starvation protein A n=1 Tax=Mucisphaera calidilacus TaxID=2527982 RepID=A0A518BWK2_9BACT|nr:carbon starvation protein A [Mucisphaera calidilacus]QDU71355.1 Carbon starvation protein A [Mucisphaera calidilacus]
MGPLVIALVSGLLLILAYVTYGRWLGRRVFELDPGAVCPSKKLNDGVDFVPTPTPVVFGHHFTSIAGTGPIVGPAIAVMWGWLPALIWILVGSIFIGAVHDFGSLVVSIRNRGQSVGEVAGRVIAPRVRLLFLLVLFMALTIVLAIFGLVIAAVFKTYPAAIAPCLLQIPMAILIGVWLRRGGRNLLFPSILVLALMYVSVIFGDTGMLMGFNAQLASQSMMWWVIALLAYSAVASVLPVGLLLQPRDYINSLQLISAMILVVLGLIVASAIGGAPVAGERPALELIAPVVDWSPANAPPMLPFLFIVIACGAISGFHCLVSSGTTSKQLNAEPAARCVGYGAMLTEGFLATIVTLACVAGLGLGIASETGTTLLGADAWNARYGQWMGDKSLAYKVGAFVDGAANFLKTLGIPSGIAVALMGVLVASFAATTLDTACRLQRYVVQELANTIARPNGSPSAVASIVQPFRGRLGATILAITVATLMAAMPLPGQAWGWDNAGKGGLILWPMFGATNQLLGGLAFMVIAFYLKRRDKPVWFLIAPLIFMLILPAWAMIQQLGGWWNAESPNWILIIVAISTLLLEAWMIAEAASVWWSLPRGGGLTTPQLDSA